MKNLMFSKIKMTLFFVCVILSASIAQRPENVSYDTINVETEPTVKSSDTENTKVESTVKKQKPAYRTQYPRSTENTNRTQKPTKEREDVGYKNDCKKKQERDTKSSCDRSAKNSSKLPKFESIKGKAYKRC